MKWFIPDQGACQVDKSHAAGQEECKLHRFITFPEIAVYSISCLVGYQSDKNRKKYNAVGNKLTKYVSLEDFNLKM